MARDPSFPHLYAVDAWRVFFQHQLHPSCPPKLALPMLSVVDKAHFLRLNPFLFYLYSYNVPQFSVFCCCFVYCGKCGAYYDGHIELGGIELNRSWVEFYTCVIMVAHRKQKGINAKKSIVNHDIIN